MKKILISSTGGGSGKDYLRKKFENKGYTFGIHYTTRPMRICEVEGVDYFYITEDRFKELIDQNNLIEYSIHNNWYYGLSYDEFINKDIFIISLKSYLKYPKEIIDSSFKIFLDIDESIRRERLSLRNDADSVDRRLKTDKEDLAGINIKDFDLVIKNDDF